jgi:TolB-like protein
MWNRVVTILMLLMLSPTLAAAQDTRPGFAVFPFANGGSVGPDRQDLSDLSVGFQQMLMTELSQNTALRVIERGMLRQLLEEQDLGASGRVDPNTAARIGKVVGAKFALLGGFVDSFGTMRLDARIVDVETSEIVKAEAVRGKREDLYDLLVDLSGRVTAGVDLPPLPTEVRKARQARKIPEAATVLYSRALVYEDRGRMDRARELYAEITQKFPEMTEARDRLNQLKGSFVP